MHYPRLIVSLALAGVFASGAALAQSSTPQPTPAPPQPQQAQPTAMPTADSQPSSGAPAFAELDTKGKGYIQRSDIPKDNEALKELRAHFSEADKDHNGRIDASEYSAYVSKGSSSHEQ